MVRGPLQLKAFIFAAVWLCLGRWFAVDMVAKASKPQLRGYGRVSSKSGDIKAQQRLLRQAGLVPGKISSDIAVSGTVPVDQRKIWQDFAKQGVSKVYVKNHKRFARSVVTQELGLKFTDKHKMEVVALDFPTLLTNRTNKGKLVRQIIAAVAEFEKDEFVETMAAARRKQKKTNQAKKSYTTQRSKGKCEGRKSLLQAHGPGLAKAVKRILRKPYNRRLSAKSAAPVTWQELGQKLQGLGFATRKMISKNGRVRRAGNQLSKSSLARLLQDMDRKRY